MCVCEKEKRVYISYFPNFFIRYSVFHEEFDVSSIDKLVITKGLRSKRWILFYRFLYFRVLLTAH